MKSSLPMQTSSLKNELEGEYLEKIRKDFPILQQSVHGKPLVYLDNSATTQKPKTVIEALKSFYEVYNANVHRGIHTLSEKATERFEHTRQQVHTFLNSTNEKEIVFTRGATEAINLVAQTYGRQVLQPGDEILLSAMEHHSNIVPWRLLAEEKKALIRVIPMDLQGELDLNAYEKLLSPRTRLVAITHVSNVLGTVNPIEQIIQLAHRQNIPVLVDGAQAVAHRLVNVQSLDCDFYVFSGHKMFGPTGVGVLYAKESILKNMPPYQGGGEMIVTVSFDHITYKSHPYRFEAGTPAIAEVIALSEAITYIQKIGFSSIQEHENRLLDYSTQALLKIPNLKIIGTAKEKEAVLSMTLGDIHPHDIGTILDEEGVAVRAGHHCAQPVMDFFDIPATARASFAFYNTQEEIDRLIKALWKVLEVLG